MNVRSRVCAYAMAGGVLSVCVPVLLWAMVSTPRVTPFRLMPDQSEYRAVGVTYFVREGDPEPDTVRGILRLGIPFRVLQVEWLWQDKAVPGQIQIRPRWAQPEALRDSPASMTFVWWAIVANYGVYVILVAAAAGLWRGVRRRRAGLRGASKAGCAE